MDATSSILVTEESMPCSDRDENSAPHLSESLAFVPLQNMVLHLEISVLCKMLGRRAEGAGNELSSFSVWQEYLSSKPALKNTLYKPRAMVL